MAEDKKENIKKKLPKGVLYQWYVPVNDQHQRGPLWYIIMIIAAVGIIIYSVLTNNLLFALIVILITYVVFLQSYMPNKKILFQISEKGITAGDQFFSYNKIKNFYIIYDPPNIKKLYFTLEGLSPNFHVPLYNKNPLLIRKTLSEYLIEDLDKFEESTGDLLNKLLKL